MTVADLLQAQDDLRAHEYSFYLWPKTWQDFAALTAFSWELRRLQTTSKSSIPPEPGIYTLLVQPSITDHPACSYLMYVGKTNSLRRRFGEYLAKEKRRTGRPKIFRLLNRYESNLWFCYSAVPETDLGLVEDSLVRAYLPPCNDQVPGEIAKVVGAF